VHQTTSETFVLLEVKPLEVKPSRRLGITPWAPKHVMSHRNCEGTIWSPEGKKKTKLVNWEKWLKGIDSLEHFKLDV
jgi:hypothetical protein